MYTHAIFGIVLYLGQTIGHFVISDNPKFGKDNKVNKAIWVKNGFKQGLYEQPYGSDFIFNANLMESDNQMQTDFNYFRDNSVQDGVLTSFFDRSKRSPRLRGKRMDKNFIKNKGEKESNSILNNKPNEEYEISVLISNNDLNKIVKADTVENNKIDEDDLSLKVIPISPVGVVLDTYIPKEINKTNNETDNYSLATPKRSVDDDQESNVARQENMVEPMKLFDNQRKLPESRKIFIKDPNVWPTSAIFPVQSRDYVYENNNSEKSEPSGKGLYKLLSALTRALKKVMKQFVVIRKIEKDLNILDKDFNRKLSIINEKMKDFNTKYDNLVNCNEKLERFEVKLSLSEQYFRKKDKEITNKLDEFLNSQKNFLVQQRKFFDIQQLILAQNEQINSRQLAIAKSQNDISQRQNNFAHILKKMKDFYNDNKIPKNKKLNEHISKVNHEHRNNIPKFHMKGVNVLPMNNNKDPQPQTTESIKINLFSIPYLEKIKDLDQDIIKEKDYHSIDDLVYKFYINNTFLDGLIKNKISDVIASETNENVQSSKNKRTNIFNLKNTILYPLEQNEDNTSVENSLKSDRKKRWIMHHVNRHSKKKHRKGKFGAENAIIDDAKPKTPKLHTSLDLKNNNDPFVAMAMNFCKQIGQDTNDQALMWCVEKSLRRLQHIDSRIPTIPPVNESTSQDFNKTTTESSNKINLLNDSTLNNSSTTTATPGSGTQNASHPVEVTTTSHVVTTSAFFPDNDELEQKLKEFEMKPDTDGNVYYDGSLHSSAMVPDTDNNGGFSDTLVGVESNSKMMVDPIALDMQSRRKAYAKHLNEDILGAYAKRKIKA